jgi:hypothetical protein
VSVSTTFWRCRDRCCDREGVGERIAGADDVVVRRLFDRQVGNRADNGRLEPNDDAVAVVRDEQPDDAVVRRGTHVGAVNVVVSVDGSVVAPEVVLKVPPHDDDQV